MVLAEPSPHHYGATKARLRNRLLRIEGQVRGIERMVDEARCYADAITQIGAVQAALDKVASACSTSTRVTASPAVSARKSGTSSPMS